MLHRHKSSDTSSMNMKQTQKHGICPCQQTWGSVINNLRQAPGEMSSANVQAATHDQNKLG